MLKLDQHRASLQAVPGADLPTAYNVASARHVYIVDDDTAVRQSLTFSLRSAEYNTRAFASGQDFLDEAEHLSPGCVLLDVRMPHLSGPEVLQQLGGEIGRFAVITMTAHGDVDTAVRAMKLGSLDFIEKPFADAVLMDALDMAFSALAPRLQTYSQRFEAAATVASLTRRERGVLENLIAGRSNKETAHRLRLSVRTVEMHRANLMNRLGVKSVAEAVRVATFAGLVPH